MVAGRLRGSSGAAAGDGVALLRFGDASRGGKVRFSPTWARFPRKLFCEHLSALQELVGPGGLSGASARSAYVVSAYVVVWPAVSPLVFGSVSAFVCLSKGSARASIDWMSFLLFNASASGCSDCGRLRAGLGVGNACR